MRAAIKMERVMGIEPTLSAWKALLAPAVKYRKDYRG